MHPTQAIIANRVYCRTLLTSSAGLENAKQLVTAYKTGKMREMTPELWQAKKIIDSTIHPGNFVYETRGLLNAMLIQPKTPDSQSSCLFECHASFLLTWSSRRACSHPVSEYVTFYTQSPILILIDCWNGSMASHQSIAQCSHQFLKREQVDSVNYSHHCQVILSGRRRFVWCSTRSQCCCA